MLNTFSIVWSILVMAGFRWWMNRKDKPGPSHPERALWIIVGISLLVRLLPALIFETNTNYDIESYKMVARRLVLGGEIYTAPDTMNRHPYLPFQMYWLGLSRLIADHLKLSFLAIVKLLPIIADSLIAVLIYLTFKKQNRQEHAFFAGMLYALNPIPMFVSAYHGQFDSIPLFLTLLAIYYLKESLVLSGLSLGLGILNKSWPVLFFPMAWEKIKGMKRKIFYTLLIGIPSILGILIYFFLFDGRTLTIVKRALTYNSGISSWGYTYFLGLLTRIAQGTSLIINTYLYQFSKYVTVLILGLIWFFYARHKKPVQGFLLILLTFFSFTHAFATQYLCWIIPFAVLEEDWKWLQRFSLAAFLYMSVAYHALINRPGWVIQFLPLSEAKWWIMVPASLPVWIICIFWFIDQIRQPASGKVGKIQDADRS
jgi:hypothetical protein